MCVLELPKLCLCVRVWKLCTAKGKKYVFGFCQDICENLPWSTRRAGESKPQAAQEQRNGARRTAQTETERTENKKKNYKIKTENFIYDFMCGMLARTRGGPEHGVAVQYMLHMWCPLYGRACVCVCLFVGYTSSVLFIYFLLYFAPSPYISFLPLVTWPPPKNRNFRFRQFSLVYFTSTFGFRWCYPPLTCARLTRAFLAFSHSLHSSSCGPLCPRINTHLRLFQCP